MNTVIDITYNCNSIHMQYAPIRIYFRSINILVTTFYVNLWGHISFLWYFMLLISPMYFIYIMCYWRWPSWLELVVIHTKSLKKLKIFVFTDSTYIYMGTAVAQWLRCCATNQKIAGSIPAGVSGFFIDIKSFWSHYGPGVDSASNRNEYQEYFLGVKAAGA